MNSGELNEINIIVITSVSNAHNYTTFYFCSVSMINDNEPFELIRHWNVISLLVQCLP